MSYYAPNIAEDKKKKLKKKLNAGGNEIFTQMIFDNSKLYNYLELLEKQKK